MDLGSRSGFVIWVRKVERRSRTDSKSDGEPIVPSLFFLSLSLSVRAGASPSPSALSLFSGKWDFEGKIETEINLHPFKAQLKSISGKCIFRAQPNTCKYGKAFPKMLFTQNKHSLYAKLEHHLARSHALPHEISAYIYIYILMIIPL